MRMEILCEVEGPSSSLQALLRRIGDHAIRAEGLSGDYQILLILTDDVGIEAINREQRGICAPTDVLSFPSVRYGPAGTARNHPKRLRQEYDPDTGCMHLGDIVLSLERAQEQAQEYGHSLTREIGFLVVHGLLHLLGYDHLSDEQRVAMRAMEEEIMKTTGLSRDLTDADFELIEGARSAMQRAYVPYSGYRVGACVRTRDGQLHQGCNVENASYGMTICAERNALTTAVTEGMQGVEAIAITSEGSMPYPCGACRQFLREFGRDIKIIIAGENEIDVTTLEALLPKSFGPESLAVKEDK